MPAESASALTHRQVLVVFCGLILVMLLSALDQTILATAMPTIVGDLGGLDHLTWVVTAYLLASTATTPLWGKFSDLFGRKRLLQGAVAVFLTGSALCGLAGGLSELIAFRALQGIGAGGLMTMAMACVADLVSPRERGRYQGYIAATFAGASVVGPLLGGALVELASWRWVFYVNLPLGLIALAVIARVLPSAAPSGGARIDYSGAALLVGFTVSLLLVCTWGGQQYAWDSPEVVGLAALAVGLLGAFVVQERRAPEPILPLRLFANRVFAIVSAALFVATCSFFAAIVFLPLYLQVVTGISPTSSGLELLPLILGSLVTSVGVGRLITRTGRYKIFPLVGLALMSGGLLWLATLDAGTPHSSITGAMALFGAGFGCVTQTLTLAIQNAVAPREIGTATAAANFFRALGGSVGVAVFGTIFAARLDGAVDPEALRSGPERIAALAPALRHDVVEAVVGALHSVFLVASPIALIGVLLIAFLEERPLRGPASMPTNKQAAKAA